MALQLSWGLIVTLRGPVSLRVSASPRLRVNQRGWLMLAQERAASAFKLFDQGSGRACHI
ncbi:hypothetical protein TomMM35A_29510 [Sphingobium sp. TomMM35A]